MLKYIKHECGNNILKNYTNEQVAHLMELVGREYNLYVIQSGQYVYKMKEIRKLICKHIKRNLKENNVSQRQLSFLVNPKKGHVSRFAPLYIAAIYDLLNEDSYADICDWLSPKISNGDNSPTKNDYTSYLLSVYTRFVNMAFLIRSEKTDDRYEYNEPTAAEPEIAYYYEQCQRLHDSLPEPIIQ